MKRCYNLIVMIKRILGISYSPVGGTARVTELMAEEVARHLRECSPEEVIVECCTIKEGDPVPHVSDDETVVVLGMPVYVGKIPLPAVKAMREISGNSAMTLAIVSYSGRSYGNALYELKQYAAERNFTVIGAGAIAISYSASRGSDRSGHVAIDMTALGEYAKAASSKIMRLGGCEVEGLKVKPAPLEVKGHMPKHKLSRLSPGAAAIAQALLDKVVLSRRESEWFL